MPQRPPLSVRLPGDDEAWLRAYAAANQSNPNAVIKRLVKDERDRVESIERDQEGPRNDPPTH
jgi:hypothetical protein